MCTTYYNIYLSVIGRLNRTVVCFNYTTCLHELSRHHYMYKLLYLMLLNIVRCLPFQDAKSVSNVFVKLRFLILRKYFIPQFNPFAIKLWMPKSLSLFHIIYICLKKKQDLKICKICLSSVYADMNSLHLIGNLLSSFTVCTCFIRTDF